MDPNCEIRSMRWLDHVKHSIIKACGRYVAIDDEEVVSVPSWDSIKR